MKLLKKIPFSHDGKDYETLILMGGNVLNIAVFSGNYPANGFRHQIILPKSADPGKLLDSDIVNEIVEKSREAVLSAKWDKLKTIIK